MEVLVRITAGELNDMGAWSKFCSVREINEYALKEGLIDYEKRFTLTIKEADDLGLLPVDLEQLIS